MSEFLQTFLALIQDRLIVLVCLLFGDVLIGVITALILKVFNPEKIVSFLRSDGLPILGWIVFVAFASIPEKYIPDNFVLPVTEWVVYGTVFLKIVGSIFKSLADAGILVEFFGKFGVKSDR